HSAHKIVEEQRDAIKPKPAPEDKPNKKKNPTD
ncbi:MAG: hypothetical protein RLZZ340_172, partial [Actinomycetota bacterium]